MYKAPKIATRDELRQYVIGVVSQANEISANQVSDATPLGAAAEELATVLAFALRTAIMTTPEESVGDFISHSGRQLKS